MTEENKNIITAKEKESLERELKELKEVKRIEIIEQLKLARSYGDLSENSEYEAAREKQATIESQISEIEKTLQVSEVVHEDRAVQSVTIGNSVEVRVDGREKRIFDIGTKADNIEVSIHAPVGEALLNKKVGDVVTVKLPNGEQEMRVVAIR